MSPAAKPSRLLWVDSARGLALWAMFAFHLTWDLGYFGWIDPALLYSRGFHWLGHAIASSFLLLVGIGLVLAGRARGPLLRSRGFWRRWAIIVAAAAAISAVSFRLFPQAPIFFGILHLIAAASLIAAPLVDAPAWLILALGALALAAPDFLAGPFFNAKIFWWTGLGTFEPPSNDYQPLFPWLGVVLLRRWRLGEAPVLHRAGQTAQRRRRGPSVLPRIAAFFGRRSLFLLSGPSALVLRRFRPAGAFRRLAGTGKPVPRPMRGPVRAQVGASPTFASKPAPAWFRAPNRKGFGGALSAAP